MRGRGRRQRWRRGHSRRAVRFLEPTLLLALHHGPTHSNTLIGKLRAFGLADMDPSAIYRALRDMEEVNRPLLLVRSRGSEQEIRESRNPSRRIPTLPHEGGEGEHH